MYVYVEQEEGKRSKKVLGGTRIKHMDWPRNDIQQLFELIGSVQYRRQWSSREAQWRKAGKEQGQPGKGGQQRKPGNESSTVRPRAITDIAEQVCFTM